MPVCGISMLRGRGRRGGVVAGCMAWLLVSQRKPRLAGWPRAAHSACSAPPAVYSSIRAWALGLRRAVMLHPAPPGHWPAGLKPKARGEERSEAGVAQEAPERSGPPRPAPPARPYGALRPTRTAGRMFDRPDRVRPRGRRPGRGGPAAVANLCETRFRCVGKVGVQKLRYRQRAGPCTAVSEGGSHSCATFSVPNHRWAGRTSIPFPRRSANSV